MIAAGRPSKSCFSNPHPPTHATGALWFGPAANCRIGERFALTKLFRPRSSRAGERGERTLRFSGAEDVYAALDRLGHMPLPPYIKRDDQPARPRALPDRFRAANAGSVAAPTAGLHFTQEILDRATAAGAQIATCHACTWARHVSAYRARRL